LCAMRSTQETVGFRRTGATVGANSSSGYGYGNNTMYHVSSTGSGDLKRSTPTDYSSRSPSGWDSTTTAQYSPREKKEKGGLMSKLKLSSGGGQGGGPSSPKEKKEKKPDSGDGGVAGAETKLGEKMHKFGDWLEKKGTEHKEKKEQKKIDKERKKQEEQEHQYMSHSHHHHSQGGNTFCTQCGCPLVHGAKFCTECGNYA